MAKSQEAHLPWQGCVYRPSKGVDLSHKGEEEKLRKHIVGWMAQRKITNLEISPLALDGWMQISASMSGTPGDMGLRVTLGIYSTHSQALLISAGLCQHLGYSPLA